LFEYALESDHASLQRESLFHEKFQLALSILSFAAVAVGGTPAFGQANRTWVSGSGTGVAPCSRTSPCATFQVAHDATNPSGEINCVDSGEFGPVIISKSITIKCVGVVAGILAAPSNLGAVQISAGATDTVVLDGLDLNGHGAVEFGVVFLTGLKLYVLNSSIRGFTASGVVNQSATAGAHAFIDDTKLIGNTFGVVGTGSTITSLTHVSVLTSSSRSVGANSSTTIIGVQDSVLNDSPVGIFTASGAQAVSVGPGNLVTGSGTFTATIPYE
jgi:hypothetical protein